ncbi:transglutaminase-like domain-containing protein [Frankia sp. QA3]|uniref:transglutaminase-like domain-containing protein n=1 Tax=Frankia sp. QA3 TaxID=710111 RepID=UPI000269CB9D|nr:transglutaminase-like domain-containing protein [Frankia sp. QA3]EIV95462.1 transglutaminase-like enzyme, predicted cysteine protease [Frankia sp. QA3]
MATGIPVDGPVMTQTGGPPGGAVRSASGLGGGHVVEVDRPAHREEPVRTRLAALVVVAGLAFVGGSGFRRVFTAHDLQVIIPVAAVVPVILTAVLGLRRRPVPLAGTVATWAGGFVVWAACTVAASAGGFWARLSLVRAGVLSGWARLLDAAVPAPPDGALLLVPAALTWLAAAVGAELVIRTRVRLLPALPAALVLAAAVAYAAPVPGSDAPLAAAFAALAAVLVRVRGSGRSRAPEGPAAASPGPARLGGGTGGPPASPRSGPGLLPVASPRGLAALRLAARSTVAVAVVVGAGLALASGPIGPDGRPPVDPRDHRTIAPVPLAALNPLSRLAGWTAHPDQVLFRVGLTPQPSGPVALRLAVLDSYDGATWSTSGRYLPAGRAIIGSPGAGGQAGRAADRGGDHPSTPVTQDLTIADLGGDLVPALARLGQFTMVPAAGAVSTSASASPTPPASTTARTPHSTGRAGSTAAPEAPAGRFAADPDDGTLVRTAPLHPGNRLRLVSTPPAAMTADRLLALTVSATPDNAPSLAVPDGVPPVLRELASVATDGGATPYQRAALLRQYLMATFIFDPTVPAGHSLAHIDHFLGQTRRGTSEQFATTFVLAARLLGLPARLVVGFTAADPHGVTRTIRGADALAWAEVNFDGAGWLPFFPTPRAGDARGAAVAGSTQGESSAQTSLVEAVLRTTVSVPPGRADVTPPGDAPPSSSDRRSGSPGWTEVVLRTMASVAVAALLGCLLLGWLLPIACHRRMRGGGNGSRARIVAAWQRVIEMFADSDRAMPRAASPSEVVLLAAGLVDEAGLTALRGLADLATLALFDDGTTGRWDEASGRRAADEAWRLLDGLERAVRRSVPRHRRLGRRISPRTVRTELRRLRRTAPAPRRAAHRPAGPGEPVAPSPAAEHHRRTLASGSGPRSPGTERATAGRDYR